MNQDLEPLKQKYPEHFANYMDDGTIGTDNSPSETKLHETIVHEFLNIFKQRSYFLKIFKCKIEKNKIEFLRFCVGQGTVQIDPLKIGEIADLPRKQKSVKEV